MGTVATYAACGVGHNQGQQPEPLVIHTKQFCWIILVTFSQNLQIMSLCGDWKCFDGSSNLAHNKRLHIQHHDDFIAVHQKIMLSKLEELFSPVIEKFEQQSTTCN